MASDRLRPENLEERLVHWAIVTTWAAFILGAVQLVFSALGWGLGAIAIARRLGWLEQPHNFVARPSPVIVSAWMAGMAVMLVALIVGHLDYDMGLGQIIKSTLGWFKGWALLAMFPFAGAMTHIRPQILIRAINVLGLQTLLITPILVASALLDLPNEFYVSPLQALLGSGPMFFSVGFHIPDPSSSLGFRLRYFAPWAPAAAFFGMLTFASALFDRHRGWRAIGIAAGLSMCFFTMSRLTIIAIPVVLLVITVASNMTRPAVIISAAFLLVCALLFLDPLLDLARDAEAAFTGARADSSRVRATIQNIGLHRWQTEAFWFGHATIERGSHLVEFMAIGSHHTWIGLLFIKGLVGFLACALPFAWTLLELLARAQRDRIARAGLAAMTVVLLFSFGENLDILAYLVWPAFLLLGIIAKRRISFAPSDRQATVRLKELVPVAT